MNRDQQKQFDEQVRQKLTSWQPISPPLGWEELANTLDHQALGFDEQLRQKLERPLSNSGTPKGWEELAQRMDQQAGDQLIHQKLRQASPPPYQTSGWNRLAARLELIARRRSAIIAYKITEISLLLSAMLLFWQFFPLVPQKTPQALPFAAVEQAKEPSSVASGTRTAVAMEPFSKRTENTPFTHMPEQNSHNGQPTANQETTMENLAKIAHAPSMLNDQAHEAWKAPPSLNMDIQYGLQASAGAVSPLESQDFAPQPQATGKTQWAMPIAPMALPSLALQLLPERPKHPQPALLLPEKLRVPGQHYLRLFVSPWDINQIVTPAFRLGEKEIARDVRFSSGRSAGLMLDVHHGKHGHSYGVIYSRRSYLPTILADAESANTLPRPSPLAPVDTNLSRITFHTISLPFQYQQQLFKKNGWQLRANVGVEANFVLKASFYKSPNFDSNIRNYLRQTGSQGIARSSNDRRELLAADLIHPEAGLLQGGSALLNSSFYVAAGFTLERELGLSASVFVAPQFTRAIYYRRQAGLGPFGDRIHHNALQLGMRWRLD